MFKSYVVFLMFRLKKLEALLHAKMFSLLLSERICTFLNMYHGPYDKNLLSKLALYSNSITKILVLGRIQLSKKTVQIIAKVFLFALRCFHVCC